MDILVTPPPRKSLWSEDQPGGMLDCICIPDKTDRLPFCFAHSPLLPVAPILLIRGLAIPPVSISAPMTPAPV